MRTIQNNLKPALQFATRSALTIVALVLPFTGEAKADQYQNCVALAAQDPDAAYDFALQWENTDTTGGALHCGGIALMSLRLFDAAAERFERAAALSSKIADADRAVLFSQAGDAWLAANNGAKARDAFSSGLHFLPKDQDLLFGRARAYDLLEAPADGLVDASSAISIAPERVDFLALRARFYRQLKQYDLAMADINAALSAGADAIPVTLERGVVRYEQGDLAGARADWQFVIDRDQRPNGAPGAAANVAARLIAEIDQESAATQP
ncbi:MAG: hypothetical protein RLN89_13085 [Parvibaculum sp.]